jgi:CheY-like chemotaxis protein
MNAMNATNAMNAMNGWTQLVCRVALVDSDALQRLCTGNSLSNVGADHVAFEEMRDVIEAIQAGHQFDAVVLGLHAGALKTVSSLFDVNDAAGRRLPVLYVVHPSEMECLHRLPAAMRAPPVYQLLTSPVDDPALLWWLNDLDLWERRVTGTGPANRR